MANTPTGRRGRQQRPFVSLWLPLFVWMGLLWFLSDRSSLGRAGMLLSFPNSDKVAHAIAFGTLAFLFYRLSASRTLPLLGRAPVFFAVLCALLYGVVDECHQAHVPGRDPSVWDLLADLVGASLVGAGLILWTDRPRGPSRAGDALGRLRGRAPRPARPERPRAPKAAPGRSASR